MQTEEPADDLIIPEDRSSGVRSSGVQESGVQEFGSSGVQEFRSSGVQEFRSQEFRSQEFRSGRIGRNRLDLVLGNVAPLFDSRHAFRPFAICPVFVSGSLEDSSLV
jgi:hypothetical protein